MNFYLFKDCVDGNNYYTYAVLEKLIRMNGHTLAADPGAAENILVSLCDVTQVPILEKVRKEHPLKTIICGGHFAINYKVCSLFADLVNIGQRFELFKCKTFDEMAALPCTYYKGKAGILKPSILIEWSALPVVQTSKKMFYYLGGVGCKNKCQFCLTSWINKHQVNSEIRIQKAERLITAGARLNVIANEYQGALKFSPVKDMMLRDFLRCTKKTTRLIRIGLEFCLEENRKKFGKPFTDDEFLRAIDLAAELKIDLQFFCIGGIEPRQAWQDFFNLLPTTTSRMPRIFFKFTNLGYEQFTPMYKRRHEINPDNYLDLEFGRKLFHSVGVRNKRIRIFPIASPALAFWRMGVQLSTTIDQYKKFSALKNSRDAGVLWAALVETKVFETDYQDTVHLWYQK